ncbi:MAG: Ig-like domain-containing protein, partial [Planctomycetaceae bacterium]|nr:Ig-like domain-containing protein [Planctomycetaceae bacterium]
KAPEGLGGAGPGTEISALSFALSVRVTGEDGTGSSSSSEAKSGRASKGSKSMRKAPVSRRGTQIAAATNSTRAPSTASQHSFAESDNGGTGSNGRDLVDLSGNNLYLSGLATSPMSATIRFLAQGDLTLLGEINLDDGTGDVDLSDESLGAGQNLLVEIVTAGGTSQAIVPSTFFANGGGYGFYITLRPDKSVVLEIFPDSAPPFNQSDNGTRVIVDTAVDCFQTGVLETAARFETPDGLVLWDANLDGVFGSPADQCRLFDTNGDGIIDAADTPVSIALDPNLDGTTADDEERVLGNNLPEDFINGVTLTATPASVVGNGHNTVTINTEIDSAPDGMPIGAVVSYEATLIEGTAAEITEGANSEPLFVRSGLSTLARTIDPFDSTIAILADGRIRLHGTVRMPVMDTDGVIKISLKYQTSTNDLPREATVAVNVTQNVLPALKNVAFSGTEEIPASVGGLRASSQAAFVVHGNIVQLTGSNFAIDPAAVIVTFNGVVAAIQSINETGTLIQTSVPSGAATGRIALIQGGVGALTSEDFVISGAPLEVAETIPANGDTGVQTDGVIALRFNQPIDGSSIEDGFEINDENGLPVVGSTVVSDDGLSLTFTPADELASNTDFTVTINGNLKAVTGARFDPDVTNLILPVDESATTATAFSTGNSTSSDSTAPEVVVSSAELIEPTTFGGNWTFSFTFSESVRAGSVFSSEQSAESDSVRLRRDENGALADITIALSEDNTVVTGTMNEDLLGLETYTLEVSADVQDIAGNALDPEFSETFTVPLHISGLSAISGPVGSEVAIRGSTFDESAEVTFNGVEADIISVYDTEIVTRVPEGASDGPIDVTIDGQTAVSLKDFVITSAGFAVRDLLAGAGAIGIAITRENIAMVSFQDAGEIGFIDLSTETVIDAIPESAEIIENLVVGGIPTEALINRSGTLGFTTNYGTPPLPGESVIFIDLEEKRMLGSTTVGKRPTRLEMTKDDEYLCCTNFIDNSVSVIRIVDRAVFATFATGIGPNGIAIAPDNERGYVANFLDASVTVFDVATLTTVGTILVGQGPARISISPDSKRLFVSNFGDGTVSVIDAKSLAVTQTITGLSGPSAMVFKPSGAEAYVANRNNNTVQNVVLNEETGEWALGEIRIATGDVPSGLAVTADGARLVITTEGAGQCSVVSLGNPQPTITGFALDEDGEPGEETLTADSRRPIWVLGYGFGTDPELLNATLDGVELDIDGDTLTPNQFRVTIPSDAGSGPIIVTVDQSGSSESSSTATGSHTGAAGEDDDMRTSNEHGLVITSKNPRVVTMFPSDGSTNVPVTTTVTLQFSEPLDIDTIFNEAGEIRELQDLPVMRIVRLADTEDGDNVLIDGNWSYDATHTRFTFSLAANTSFLAGNSNNRYQVVVNRNVHDKFGNQVVGAATSFASSSDSEFGSSVTSGVLSSSLGFRGHFQTIDNYGPFIQSARFRDLNNNGVDEGDQLELIFNERIKFNEVEDLIETNAITISGGGDSLGDTLLIGLGSTNRRVVCTLGAGATFTVGDGGSAVNMVSEATNAFNDYANLRPIANPDGDVEIELDTSSDNGENPRLFYAAWLDANNSNTVNAGDTLRLIFNEPVVAGDGATDPTVLFTLSSGGLGAGAIFLPQTSGNGRELDIQLGVGATFNEGTTTIAPVGNGNPPVMNEDEIRDYAGNPAYAGTHATVTIEEGLPGAVSMSTDDKPVHLDLEGTAEGVSEGDAIVVTFTGPLIVNPVSSGSGRVRPGDVFALGILGDRFGTGAFISFAPVLTLADSTERFIQPNEVVIILGSSPVVTPGGEFGVDIFTGGALAGRAQ